MDIVVGAILLLLGAVGASAATRSLEESGRVRWLPLALVPPGALIGAGAATLRGWNLWGTLVTGAVFVPLAGMGMVVVQRRRTRKRP